MKRFGTLLVLLTALLLCGVEGAFAREDPLEKMQGVFYFPDLGLESGLLTLSLEGYAPLSDGYIAKVHSQPLTAKDYDYVQTVERVIAFDFHPNGPIPKADYAYLQYVVEIPESAMQPGLRRLRSTATLEQAMAAPLFVYRAQMQGVPEDFIQSITVYAGEREVPLQTLSVLPWGEDRQGFDDGDILWLLGGDRMTLVLDGWRETYGELDAELESYRGQADLSHVSLGSSLELPLTSTSPSLPEASLVLTKSAPLRFDAELPEPIGTLRIRKDGAGIRAGSSTADAVLQRAGEGEVFSVVSRTISGWYEVLLEDGTTGFIFSEMVSYTPE